jgi:hypothetical protein
MLFRSVCRFNFSEDLLYSSVIFVNITNDIGIDYQPLLAKGHLELTLKYLGLVPLRRLHYQSRSLSV